MPVWVMHLVTADKVCKKLKIKDKNSFLFGNIMPDVLNNYIVKNTNEHKSYDETHFAKDAIINGIELKLPDSDRFFRKYKEKMKNPVVCGYYMHLLTDYYWNNLSYNKFFYGSHEVVEVKFLNGEIKKYEYDDAVGIKQEDFKLFTRIFKI